MSPYRLNILSWNFYVQFVLFTFIGATLTVWGVPHYLIDLVSVETKRQAYWFITITMISTPLAMVIAQQYLFGGNIRTDVQTYFNGPLQKVNNQAVYWVILTFVVFLATTYVYLVLRRIPFLILFSNLSSFDLALTRAEAKYNFAGNEYIRNLFSVLLAPLTSYVAYSYYWYYKRPFYRWWFWSTVLITVAALTYNNEKSPIIIYFLSLYFATTFIKGKANKKQLATIGLVTFGLLVATYVLFANEAVSQNLFTGIVNRIVLSQYAGVPLTLSAFPRLMPFLWGSSFPAWLASLFNQEHLASANALNLLYRSRAVEEGTAGVINSFFIAEAWANFGWMGVLIAPVWIGVLMQFIYYKLITAPKTPVNVALMTYFMTAFPITGGFVGFVWNPAWFFFGILTIVGLSLNIKYPSIQLRLRWHKAPRST